MIVALNVLLYILLNKMQHDNILKEKYILANASLKSQEQLVIEARERYAEIRTLRQLSEYPPRFRIFIKISHTKKNTNLLKNKTIIRKSPF